MRSIAARAAAGWRRPRLGRYVDRVADGALDRVADPELDGRVLVLVRESGHEPDARASHPSPERLLISRFLASHHK
jgi:hypothetical protein